MLLFLLIVSISSEIIYEKRFSGKCTTPFAPIHDKTICETQALAVGWSDTTASVVSFSSYLPEGCVYTVSDDVLKLYTKESSKDCSNSYNCLCSLTAPLCQIGINENTCVCGDNSCRHDNGLVCSVAGDCSHAPACQIGSNSEVCQCGSEDCTPKTGLECSVAGECSHANVCLNTDGSSPNSGLCQCGSRDCSQPYCFSSQNKCVDACPAGTFRNNLLTCSDCSEKGYYCPSGSTLSETTFPCPVGKWSDQIKISSLVQCFSCPVGKWSDQLGISSVDQCQDCSSGRWSDKTEVTSNDGCKDRCSVGKWSTKTGLHSDTQCEGRCSAGRYSSISGLTSNSQCFGCSSGKWSSQLGLTSDESCLGKCSLGKFSAQIGLVSDDQCKICGVNKYQDELGKTFCKGCPSDKLISDTITASKHWSIDDCIEAVPVCLITEYLKDKKCISCEPSYFCDGISMKECAPGSYCDSGIVHACPTGYYGEKKSQTSLESACKKCSEGTYQNVAGQTYCSRGCPRGKFGQVVGASSETEACQDCLIGHQCSTTMMNRPTKCPLGTYQMNTGSEVCLLCPKNNYSDTLGSVVCKACGQHLQTLSLGANSRSQCILQTKTCSITEQLLDTNECQSCLPGSFGTKTGCRLCPKGFNQPLSGSKECMSCQSKRCQLIMGVDELSSMLPKVFTNSINRTSVMPVLNKYYVLLGSVIAYITLAVIIIILVATHRFWPTCFFL